MISIEQIRKLESKIQEVVELLNRYKTENHQLKDHLKACEAGRAELEALLNQYKDEQGEIEQGIIKALEQLDSIEDIVGNMKADGRKEEVDSSSETQIDLASAEDPEEEEDKEEIEIDIDANETGSSYAGMDPDDTYDQSATDGNDDANASGMNDNDTADSQESDETKEAPPSGEDDTDEDQLDIF